MIVIGFSQKLVEAIGEKEIVAEARSTVIPLTSLMLASHGPLGSELAARTSPAATGRARV